MRQVSSVAVQNKRFCIWALTKLFKSMSVREDSLSRVVCHAREIIVPWLCMVQHKTAEIQQVRLDRCYDVRVLEC